MSGGAVKGPFNTGLRWLVIAFIFLIVCVALQVLTAGQAALAIIWVLDLFWEGLKALGAVVKEIIRLKRG